MPFRFEGHPVSAKKTPDRIQTDIFIIAPFTPNFNVELFGRDVAGCKINSRFGSCVARPAVSTLREGGTGDNTFRSVCIASGVFFADTGMGQPMNCLI